MENTKINECEIGFVSMLSRKCQKCMYRDYCKEKRNEAALFNISSDQQIFSTLYDTQIIPLSVGVSANDAVDALANSMLIMGGRK